MAKILVFHHVLGLTEGLQQFGHRLSQAGHEVVIPDLFDGNQFDDLASGISFVKEVGFDAIIERGVASAQDMDERIFYAGFSLGVLPAQKLAQTRPGAMGALLYHACVSPEEFSPGWPETLPAQIHGMDHDPEFADSGDLDVARQISDANKPIELFLYSGNGHLFADSSSADFNQEATDLLIARTLEFIDRYSDE